MLCPRDSAPPQDSAGPTCSVPENHHGAVSLAPRTSAGLRTAPGLPHKNAVSPRSPGPAVSPGRRPRVAGRTQAVSPGRTHPLHHSAVSPAPGDHRGPVSGTAKCCVPGTEFLWFFCHKGATLGVSFARSGIDGGFCGQQDSADCGKERRQSISCDQALVPILRGIWRAADRWRVQSA